MRMIIKWLCLAASIRLAVCSESCAVITASEASGDHLDTVELTAGNFLELDAACCAACSANSDCTFWQRKTTSNKCYLYNNWKGNSDSDHYRVGFKSPSKLPCSIMKFVYGVLGNILKHIPISFGSVIQKMHLELPDNVQCVMAHQGGNNVLMLKNVTLMADSGFDLRQSKNSKLNEIYGTVSAGIMLDPEVGVNMKTCEAQVNRLNLWNLGVGINNLGGRKELTSSLSGSLHSGLRGMDCEGVIAANPSSYYDGHEVAQITLKDSTQEVADRSCCRLCREHSDCEAFVVGAHRALGERQCSLKRLSSPSSHYHANFRGNATTMGKFEMSGDTVGEYVVNATSQIDIDTTCATLCDAVEECEVWEASTRKPECYLLRASHRHGLLNEGIFGISGRSIVNHMADKFLGKMLNKVASYACGSTASEIASILGSSIEVWGEGEFALDVPAEFFSSIDMSSIGKWTATSFPVVTNTVKVTARHSLVQQLVDDLVHEISSTLGSDITDQIGTPIGFFLAGLISACVQDDGSCLSSTIIV